MRAYCSFASFLASFLFLFLNSFLFYSAELKVDMDGLAAYAKNVFIRVIL